MEIEIYKMKYKTEEDNENIRILGENFIRNNKNKVKLIIDNKRYKLKDIITIWNFGKDILKTKLISYNNSYNKSYMFKDCTSLLEFSIDDFEYLENQEKFDNEQFFESNEKENLNDENNDFDEENSFYNNLVNTFIPSEITKINEERTGISEILNYNNKLMNLKFNSIILHGIFYGCTSLSSLPPKLQLNNENVIDLSDIFFNCFKLKSLPDISN